MDLFKACEKTSIHKYIVLDTELFWLSDLVNQMGAFQLEDIEPQIF